MVSAVRASAFLSTILSLLEAFTIVLQALTLGAVTSVVLPQLSLGFVDTLTVVMAS